MPTRRASARPDGRMANQPPFLPTRPATAPADQTRRRVLRAARDLLTSKGGTGRFSLDAVAERAGVARMTVYYWVPAIWPSL